MRYSVYVGVIIWYLIAGTSVGEKSKALVYNYKKRTLIHLPGDLSNLPCENWITGCPANRIEEQSVNTKHSLYNAALFLRNIYSSKDTCTKLVDDKAECDTPVEMSMAYSSNLIAYEFGYEMFHEKSKLSNISSLSYENYYPMKNFDGSKGGFSRMMDRALEGKKRKAAAVNPIMIGTEEMEFLWIPLVVVHLNGTKFRLVEYEIRKNNINPKQKCDDYSLGKEVLNETNLNVVYSPERQKKLFQKVTLPSLASESEPDEIIEGECPPELNCLTKWPLLPTDQFQFLSNFYSKCSNVTTIPLWRGTHERIMEKLEKYLYALQRISGQPLKVVAGGHGILALPRHHQSDLKITLQEAKTEIKVPKLIYKMVHFKLNPCKMKNCWYGVLIVIHNGPYPPTEDKDFVCAKDRSGDFGWEEIQYETWSNEGAHSKFIYVCEITKKILKNVGVTLVNDRPFKPIKLLKFPIFNKEEQKFTFEPLRKKLYDELVRLSTPGEEVKLNDGVIERPTIYDNFGSNHQDDFAYSSDKDENGERSDTDSNV